MLSAENVSVQQCPPLLITDLLQEISASPAYRPFFGNAAVLLPCLGLLCEAKCNSFIALPVYRSKLSQFTVLPTY